MMPAARAWKWLAGIALVLAALAAVHLYGEGRYGKGVDDERKRQLDQAVAAAQSRSKADRAVGRLPDGAAAEQLRRHWSRD
ncbi:hypothetical protein [Alcaligenes sp. SDU_A2]|uniref:hypothetical protein n=1 Tax=Alcaligenes sp. SDU_A2 TaxID=3136634 RepID=UPI002BF214E3|nr:hypothetical protein [Alcaligenes sp.]